MDTLLNIRAFLAAAHGGSLSAAARQLRLSPSVIAKRVDRLQDEMGVALFIRSTRKLELTEIGKRYVPRYRALLNELDTAIKSAAASPQLFEGHLRIKCPTTLAVLYFGEMISDFQLTHPKVSIDLVLMDRSVNPVEEGFDIAFGALPASYAGVVDEPLCPYPRVLCAAPSYISRHGAPEHPRDLVHHDCLPFTATGFTWGFESPRGEIRVEVHSKLSANDAEVLHRAALKGLGIAILERYIVTESLDKGLLIPLLPAYPVPDLWLKALVPQSKIKQATIHSLLEWIKDRVQPIPPWSQ